MLSRHHVINTVVLDAADHVCERTLRPLATASRNSDRVFDLRPSVPQGLKPKFKQAIYGTAEQVAEKRPKVYPNVPQRLKPR